MGEYKPSQKGGMKGTGKYREESRLSNCTINGKHRKKKKKGSGRKEEQSYCAMTTLT